MGDESKSITRSSIPFRFRRYKSDPIVNWPIAILAGGLGTRLHPITLDLPKSLLLINGQPFIKWQLELLARRGVKSVVLCLGHQATEIVEFVGSGHEYGLSIEYSIEKNRLGTGGALKNAEGVLGETFGVLYGDSYLPINYLEIFNEYQKTEKSVIMTIYENQNKYDFSNVLTQSDGSLYYSKKNRLPQMKYIDYGFSVLSCDALKAIPREAPSDLSDMLENLSRRGEVQGYEITERFYEIGSFQGIVELEEYLRSETK
jgi:MurNAc alpha-1-phosphate uridylyltransferase